MSRPYLPLFALALVVCLSVACPAPDSLEVDSEQQPWAFTAPEEGYETEELLICTIYFYSGHTIGRRNLTTGPQMSADGGRTWSPMAWSEIITNGVAVGPWGKWVYCACGNGVLASADGGRNWRLSGGWEMAEIQDVAIGPESPLVVWAAGAYGLYLSEDGANTWIRPGDPQPFRYVDVVCPDREDANHVLIGTEDGLFVTSDRGESYDRAGPDVAVRSIVQDSRDAASFWMGTDGMGLWRSEDAGETWEQVEGAGDVVNRVAQHPENPDWIFCGIGHGVGFSLDGGLSWESSAEGFGEFSPVYAIAFDSDSEQTICAGARDGFYISEDGGRVWHTYEDVGGNVVLGNAVIFDVWQGELYRGPEEAPSDEPGTLAINTAPPEGEEYRDAYAAGFEERAQAAASRLAERAEERLASLEEGRHVDLWTAIALIREGRADEALWEDLRAQLADFGHSMFDSFPAISLYLYCEEQLPDDIGELIRRNLVSNRIYRGDTENHWVMYYTALLLTAQTWPEASANEWYTGRATQENYDEALGWINEWCRITTTIGQGEFDSPAYYTQFVVPCIVLYDFADDPVLKRRTGMMVDLLLADMAVESLYGRYCGGHSRMYDSQVVMGDHDNSASFFSLYFGEINLPDSFMSWLVAGVYGSYRCPQAIADIALRREAPYVHTEVKRVRNCMRYCELLNPPVYKYTYMTPNFCLGSLQGGILQPIQQHTWDVTWVGSAPNTTLFSLHPYYSADELAMFFPEDPHMLTASVQSQKSTYTDPDKLCSSSPHERVFQHEDTLLAVYNIPEGASHEHVTLYMPECLQRTEAGGWIFGNDGDVFIAVYPCTRREWLEEPDSGMPPAERLRIRAGQTALVVEVGRAEEDGDFSSFVGAIRSLRVPHFMETDEGPVVRYLNRHGHGLEYHWGADLRLLDGALRRFPDTKLFEGPMVMGGVNRRIIHIRGDDVTRTLDFTRSTIEEIPGR